MGRINESFIKYSVQYLKSCLIIGDVGRYEFFLDNNVDEIVKSGKTEYSILTTNIYFTYSRLVKDVIEMGMYDSDIKYLKLRDAVKLFPYPQKVKLELMKLKLSNDERGCF